MKGTSMMKKKIVAGVIASVMALGMTAIVAAPANAGIKLWQLNNYSGEYLGDFGTGTSYVGTWADNRASSIKVDGVANYAILHQFRDYQGAASTKFTDRSPNLGSWGFDNLTSSIS